MEHRPLLEPDGTALGIEPADQLEQPGTVHLSRFNVLEVEDLEDAIASHLGVSRDHIAPDGFVVVPDDGDRLLITWASSAAIDIQEFQAIVASATAANERSVPRATLPGPLGPIARPRRKLPRRARRSQVDETG